MKIKTLTAAQQQLMPGIRDKWINKVFVCNTRIDRAKATEGINWLYEFSGLQKPMIMYVDSPLACHYAVSFINSIVKDNTDQVKDQVMAQVRSQVWDQVEALVRAQVGAQVRDQVWDQVGAQVSNQIYHKVGGLVWSQVWDQVDNHVLGQVEAQIRDRVGAQVRDQIFNHGMDKVGNQEYYSYHARGDYGWLSLYDYFKTIGVLQDENVDKFIYLADSGIYDMIQLRNFSIVMELPVKISRNNQNRLHCEDGSAIEWADGYCQYYWNDITVTKKLIETPHLITKEEILKETKVEVRRCILEKLGVEYYNRLGGEYMHIKTLTPAQQELIPAIRDKWLNRLFNCNTGIDRAKATEGINWLYEFSGLQKPMIIFVDSLLACQYAVHYIKAILTGDTDQVSDDVRDEHEDKLRDDFPHHFGDQGQRFKDHVWDQVWDQIRVQFKDHVSDQVWDQIRVQFKDQGWIQINDQIREELYNQLRDQGSDDAWGLFRAGENDRAWEQVRVQLEIQFMEQVSDEASDQAIEQFSDEIRPFRTEFRPQIRSQVEKQVGRKRYYDFSEYGQMYDSEYRWLAYYDYFKTIGVLQNDNFDKFLSLVDSGICDIIQLKNLCIVSELPVKISKNNQNRLHCEDGPAIEWADGYSQYYWNGVAVPKKLIETPHLITKEEILKESNAELRRCMREKLGVEEYYNRLGGVILMDEDTDDQGNIMKLFRSKEIDSVINKYVQYLQVICPSTKREYILYPPNQTSTNVWEAKASTFLNEKIQYRHGDVGLLNVNKQFSKPSTES